MEKYFGMVFISSFKNKHKNDDDDDGDNNRNPT